MQITSPQNLRVKQAARLRDRRGRQQQGRFCIDGLREIGRALAAGWRAEEAFFCPQHWRDAAEGERLVAQLLEAGAEVWEVTPAVSEKLAFGQRDEGLVVVARSQPRLLEDLTLPAAALVAVVEGVEKPGNLGAILRSADGAGLSAVIAADPTTDWENPNTIRASLGTVFSLPTATGSAAEVRSWLAAAGLTMYAARPDATLLYWEANFRGPAAIVLGAEDAGLSAAWEPAAGPGSVQPLVLPMLGVADSLNVSTSAAVLFYEARRQRMAPAER